MPAVRRRKYNATWEELESLPSGQRMTPYRDQTYALQWTDADPYFPGQMWNEPTAIGGEEFDTFQDPEQYTYFKYVTERADSSRLIDSWLYVGSDLISDVTPEWVSAWEEVFSPFKFAQAGLATQTSAMSSYVKSSYENFFLVFEALDDLNVVYRTVQLARTIRSGPPAVEPRTYWREAPYFQPLRELMDKTAAFSDVYEVALAHNLFTRPLLNLTYYEILREWSRHHHDFLSARIFTDLKKSMVWHDAGGARLLGARIDDDTANRDVLIAWATTWGPEVLDAVRPVIEHLGQRFGDESGAHRLMEAAQTLVNANIENLGTIREEVGK